MDSDGDYEDVTTPEEVLRKMTATWQNELSAPSLLPNEMELVEILLDQIQGMEENILRQKDKTQLRISIHRVELQRISYITSDYIRCRLEKIEENPHFALEMHRNRLKDGQTPLLAEQELKFAEEYAKNEAQLFQSTVLEFLPAALKKVTVPKPDEEVEMVYAKVVADDVGNVAIPDWADLNAEVILEMDKDSVHLIPFASVRHLVEKGDVQLL